MENARVNYLQAALAIVFASPHVVIERVNTEIIRDVAAEFYLTAFVGYLDLHDNKLTYFHAGRFKQLSQFGGQAIKELIA
jgi:serine phosphatase RsbU (regulator of sigma subunit)